MLLMSNETAPKKITVSFDVVAEEILSNHDIFCMRDTDEIFIYENGVYRNNGAEKKLRAVAKDVYSKLYDEEWDKINSEFIIKHIDQASSKYVYEVISYIKDYRQVSREEIDEEQLNYINFKNGLFDLGLIAK